MLSFILLPLVSFLAGCSAQADAAFPTAMTDEQNHFRAIHQAPNLTWSATIASAAQTHVSSCAFQLYAGPGGYGQILSAGSFNPVQSVVDWWYAEEPLYNYSSPGFSQDTGAFTQLVWRASSLVGCGEQDCDGVNGTPGVFVACFYSPAGNVLGRFAQNVLPPVATAGVEEAEMRVAVGERRVLVASSE